MGIIKAQIQSIVQEGIGITGEKHAPDARKSQMQSGPHEKTIRHPVGNAYHSQAFTRSLLCLIAKKNMQ
ncbi:MAG TPA: hypothetical protein DCR97_06505 [Deltaproteobacteria bacterium]|nr:hypothetical protein [Deltaproteobacteria bacterium]